MALVQHDRPGTVQLSCCAEVDVGDNQIEEGSEMFMASSTCHEVVPSRDGEQVKNIRADSLQECYSFMGGEGG